MAKSKSKSASKRSAKKAPRVIAKTAPQVMTTEEMKAAVDRSDSERAAKLKTLAANLESPGHGPGARIEVEGGLNYELGPECGLFRVAVDTQGRVWRVERTISNVPGKHPGQFDIAQGATLVMVGRLVG